jgi:hypothetical protein
VRIKRRIGVFVFMRVLVNVGEIHATPDTPNSHPFGNAASENPRARPGFGPGGPATLQRLGL